MKNILVPTDFSACAAYAVDLGLALAELFDAQVHLFTVIDIPTNWDGLTTIEQNKLPGKQQLIENANVLLEEWKQKADLENIQLQTIITGGSFLEKLQHEVITNDIDFVVMGSHGASGKQEYFMGSNTQKVIRKLHVPIFVIKKSIGGFAFKNVVFASDFDADEKEIFIRFLDFINWFAPDTIHLLSVNTSGWFAQPALLMREAMKDFKALCKDYNCKTHFYRGLSVDAGIRHFSEDIDADLIVVSNHNRSALRRIFAGSNIEALVNHSDLPILSLAFNEAPVLSTK